MDISEYTKSNKAAWDASAVHHLKAEEWQRQLAGFRQPGFSTFDDTMERILVDLPIEDKSVVQIGCNNGREILSAVSLGAKEGLGIDQSTEFLKQAEELNKVAKLPCDFLCANVYDLPEKSQRQFDVGIITIGVLAWMPDLPRFFSAVGGLIKRSGKLVIYETHPFLEMFVPDAPDPFKPSVSYFAKTPYRSDEALVYDGSQQGPVPSSYWFNHKYSDVINACIHSGLSIVETDEFSHSNREVDYDVYTNQAIQLPMSFSLIAEKQL